MTSEKKTYLNEANCDKLIAALETEAARKMFDMNTWASRPDGAKPPKEAYRSGGGCGTTCCIGGLAAIIDPTFFDLLENEEEDGTYSLISKEHHHSDDCFAEWLGISLRDEAEMASPFSSLWAHFERTNITHAINLLRAFKSGGIEAARAVAKKQREKN